MNLTIKTVFAIVSVYLLFAFLTLKHWNASRVNERQLREIETSLKVDAPDDLYIPKLKLKLEVKPGVYDTKSSTWQVSNDYPHFATISAYPNTEKGTTVIYAHNSKKLFGSIKKLKLNDKIFIKTKNNKIFVYSFVLKETVLPNNLSVFKSREVPYLALVTCTGRNNELRSLLYFKLEKAV